MIWSSFGRRLQMTNHRLDHMPGVVAWLRKLRDEGPQRRTEGRSGHSARKHGFTDFWVLDDRLGEPLFLSEVDRSDPEWYKHIDYGQGEEMITDEGLRALKDFE